MLSSRIEPQRAAALLQQTSQLSFKALTIALGLGGLSAIGVVAATPAAAQATGEDSQYTGAKARVNRSASLRSLTEAVASAGCRVAAGIETDTARSELAKARNDFATIMDGLTNGSAALGMPGAERRSRTIQTLDEARALWDPMAAAAERLASSSGSADDAATISNGRAELFDKTELLAAVISGQYADPQQLLQSDATVLNFAVRQRALGYKMTRTMCELASGTGTDATRDELREATDLFERSLTALRDGFPAAGINPPPNPQVYDSLSQTFALWSEQKGIFANALAGGTPTNEEVAQSAALSQALSSAMNNTITLYLIATPGQDGVYRVPLEAYAKDELAQWLTNPELIAAIKAQNDAHAGLSEDDVIALDQQWRAEASANGGPLVDKLMTAPVSEWLMAQQAATAGFVTEVFVMDDKGLNVAQSAVTSDYWQGDEAKWQETYLVGPDALHISEVEFDDSTGFYQTQASLPITDPATGEVIGAITYGINIQSLM